MTEFITGLLKKVSNVLLVASIVTAGAGIAVATLPEYSQEIMDLLGLSAEQMGLITAGLTGVAAFGSLAKYSSTVLTKVTALNKTQLETQMAYAKEQQDLAIQNLSDNHNQELVVFTETVNDLVDEVKNLRAENQKLLEINAITAKRNITSNLVSPEDKELYQSFLSNLTNNEVSQTSLKNLYTTITSIVEQVKETEIVEETVDILEDKLSDL